MIAITNIDTYGWEAAIRGMRNPMNSWGKCDSHFTEHGTSVGENDLKLMKNLSNAGDDHGKFLRMITVTMDVNAPLYWWKEFDTYKVGTVANSCSTMHKIHAKEFTIDDFSHDHLTAPAVEFLKELIKNLNDVRDAYINFEEQYARGEFLDEITCKKDVWWQLIQLLPSSYNQKRTVQLNYQVLKHMYHARKNHKLDEWRVFCSLIEVLPYSELITGEGANHARN